MERSIFDKNWLTDYLIVDDIFHLVILGVYIWKGQQPLPKMSIINIQVENKSYNK